MWGEIARDPCAGKKNAFHVTHSPLHEGRPPYPLLNAPRFSDREFPTNWGLGLNICVNKALNPHQSPTCPGIGEEGGVSFDCYISELIAFWTLICKALDLHVA